MSPFRTFNARIRTSDAAVARVLTIASKGTITEKIVKVDLETVPPKPSTTDAQDFRDIVDDLKDAGLKLETHLPNFEQVLECVFFVKEYQRLTEEHNHHMDQANHIA
ncbi:hypothetical protein F0562_019581 [Nyssa sinensis]|uniref:Uncharacterized protein n=1 Tax=Nyssa sinensis TaxID=561372 RepID=A0A5J5BNT2_9ASTE|nr:hypothetical protein F0562_019581 [Nyssa sinensis]